MLAAAGGLGERQPLPAESDLGALAPRIAARLKDLLPEATVSHCLVLLTAGERRDVLAFGHGHVVLVVVPADGSADPEQIASAAAETLVANAFPPAAPGLEHSEPLLALGETLGRAGALALAALPPSLRPVSDWLEASAARTTLETFAREMLDAKTVWATRRARLAAATRPGGAPPALAKAAGALLECLGTPSRLASSPQAFWEAWTHYEGKACPALPRPLRRALADPARAGMPEASERHEGEAIAASARDREVELGALTPPPAGPLSSAQVLLIAARMRAQGAPGMCGWLRDHTVPTTVPSGCRDDETHDGVLAARPRPGQGFEVVWIDRDGSQQPLLVWPRWVLSPALWQRHAAMCFVDQEGIWSVPLDAATAPALLAAGEFRRLAPSPDGSLVAAAAWPSSLTAILDPSGKVVSLPVASHAGLGWLDRDVLATANPEHLGLFAPDGEGRPQVLATPGATAMAVRAGKIYLAEDSPGGYTLVRVDLGTGQRERLLDPPAAVSALSVAADGSIFMATGSGIWRWRPGEPARRQSDAFSLGP